MMKFVRSLVFISLFTNLLQAVPPKVVERKLYVGKDSVEANMKFDFAVEVNSPRTPSAAKAHEAIESQLSHLFGPMGEAKQRAVPKGDHDITLLKKEKVGEGVYSVSYRYSGTIVIHVPPSGLKATYPVFLPYNPETIYEASAVTYSTGLVTFPCTDDHYDSEGDFWYFWNPKKVGCPLKEGTDYARVEAQVKAEPNTRVSYPEYARLVNDEGEITISLLMGMDDPSQGRDPLESEDINAENYRDIRESLLKAGYESRLWTKSQVKTVSPVATGPLPYVEDFTKTLAKATLRIRMFFGPSGINEESQHFHYFFKDGLEKASVLIYDGHSGLGGHLDLPTIESLNGFKFKLDPNQYQIYFFNSCSSYTYYNTMFFAQKASESDPRGTKNLDILTNGLATYFSVMHNSNRELMKAIESWANAKGSVTYQAIAKKVDSGNLFGVNGDEDNPKKP